LITKNKKGRSFTLVELLVVIGIMVLLAVLAVPAFNSIAGAHSVVSGVYRVQAFVELARDEAVSRQSYVWIAVTNAASGANTPEVVLAATASIDGSTNNIQTNLTSIAPPLRISGMVLTNWGALKPATQSFFTNGVPESVSTNTGGITFHYGSQPFGPATITFTPRGEAMLLGTPGTTDGYTENIDISLRQAHGTTVSADADDAAVVIDGATGNPLIVRIQ